MPSDPNPTQHVVILAAGLGTRLGCLPLPKALTVLEDGHSIMAQQLANITAGLGDRARVSVVVGFKKEAIMEAFPQVSFVYNEEYDQTNTSQSLLKALRASPSGGVLWLNGDVVFSPAVLERLAPLIASGQSLVTVNTSSVGEEEVKYTCSGEGVIAELSKQVATELAQGEAVGINYVSAADKPALIQQLASIDPHDYFERGIELTIATDGCRWQPVDISDLYAVEVDFPEDLARANAALPGFESSEPRSHGLGRGK